MKDDDDTDEALILAFKAGDQEAFAILVKRWHKTFCSKAYWITRNKNVAKDVAQESWTTIIEKMDSLQDPKKFKFWAIRIVCNKSTDWLRSQSKKATLKESIEFKDEDTRSEYFENENLKVILRNAIHNLPENQQIVIKLFYMQSYSLKQISDLLNISIGTAKSRLFHAREKIKTTLKNSNYEN